MNQSLFSRNLDKFNLSASGKFTLENYIEKAKQDAIKWPEKWEQRYLALATHISQWSKDPSTRVGAVIVRPDRSVASVGFNGFARGVADAVERYEDRSIKYEIVVHGEVNAVVAAREALHGYTLYTVPFMPCSRCTAIIINAGIKHVVSTTYRMNDPTFNFNLSLTQLYEADVGLTLYPHE
jgi:dCMP deaminase